MNTSRRVAGHGVNYSKYIVGFLASVSLIYFVWIQQTFSPNTPVLKATVVNEAKLETAVTEARAWTRQPGRRYVWIDVEIDGSFAGRVTAELYMDIVPATAENFRALVTGDNAAGISYKGSKCHRIITGFIVQCGDYETGKGYGGKSIYGGKFDDEPAGLKLKHDSRYVLQMANAGPNTNGAQFCFMLGPAPHLNGHHVVFGRVVDGFNVVDQMEESGVKEDGIALNHNVILKDGGEYLY